MYIYIYIIKLIYYDHSFDVVVILYKWDKFSKHISAVKNKHTNEKNIFFLFLLLNFNIY